VALSHAGSLPIRLSASNIPLRHLAIRSKLQFRALLQLDASVLCCCKDRANRPMTLIEAAKDGRSANKTLNPRDQRYGSSQKLSANGMPARGRS